MLVLTSDVGLEPGLPVDQIESRLIDAARRHHLEERNIAYWLLELRPAAVVSSAWIFVDRRLSDGARRDQAAQGAVSGFHRHASRETPGDSGSFRQWGADLDQGEGRSFRWRLRKRKRSGSKRPRCFRTGTSKKKCAAMMEGARAHSPRSRSRCRSKCWRCGTTPTSSPSV